MKTPISSREWEALSAYLDRQLNPKERSRLEMRLQADLTLRTTLDELRRARLVLRNSPRLRVPHGFTLNAQQAHINQPARTYPALRLASLVASLIFVIVLLSDFLTGPLPMSGRKESLSYAPAPAEAGPTAAAVAPVSEAARAPEPTSPPPAALDMSQPTFEATVNVEQNQLQAKSAAPDAASGVPQATAPADGLQAKIAPTEAAVEGSLMAVAETATPEEVMAASDTTGETRETDQNEIQAEEDTATQQITPPPANQFPWRVVEVLAGMVALATGLAAYLAWRKNR